MLKKTGGGFYVLGKFTGFPGLIHGFSTKSFGNMKFGFGDDREVIENRQNFAKLAGFPPETIVEAEQVHGAKVASVGEKDARQKIKGVDGLVTGKTELYLLVKTADCIPVLFFDPVRKTVGIAHAGWKGVLAKIGSGMVEIFETQFGCRPKDILIGLGPSIGDCCYKVTKQRALRFQNKFGKEVVKIAGEKWYLNLRQALVNDLISRGILPSNIESSFVCTCCQGNDFFSYRREGENLSGEIAAVIGMKD